MKSTVHTYSADPVEESMDEFHEGMVAGASVILLGLLIVYIIASIGGCQ